MINKISIIVPKDFNKILKETLKEREYFVITNRYALNNKKMTLSEIGKKLNLSRERVRQLESEIKIKIYKILEEKSPGVVKKNISLINQNGGIVSDEELNSGLETLLIDVAGQFKKIKNHAFIKNGWVFVKLNLNEIEKSHKNITDIITKLGEVVKINRIKAEVGSRFVEKNYETIIRCSKNIIFTKDGSIGLKSNRVINPKTVADKITYALEEEKKPMHFREIAKKIIDYNFDSKQINHSTVHNELIANEKFVLVGRGIYAQKIWGYKKGTIADIIKDFLKYQEKPQKLESILDFLSRERIVKKNTILVNLTKNSEIAKTSAGEYYIK